MNEINQDIFVCSINELKDAGKHIINHGGEEIVVFWNSGEIKVINLSLIHI